MRINTLGPLNLSPNSFSGMCKMISATSHVLTQAFHKGPIIAITEAGQDKHSDSISRSCAHADTDVILAVFLHSAPRPVRFSAIGHL